MAIIESDLRFSLNLGGWDVYDAHTGVCLGHVDGEVAGSDRPIWTASGNGVPLTNKTGKPRHFPSRAAAARALIAS
jgi:hypothetical protein